MMVSQEARALMFFVLGAVVAIFGYRFVIFNRESHVAKVGEGLSQARPHRAAILIWEYRSGYIDMLNGVVDTLKKESKTIGEIKVFDANANRINLKECAEQIVRDNYDIVVPITTSQVQMMKEVVRHRRSTMPIVFCGTGDPVKSGCVESFEKPGKGITGHCIAGFTFVEPMLNMIDLFAPDAKRILIPYNPSALGGSVEEYRAYMTAEFEKRGCQVKAIQIYQAGDIRTMLHAYLDECDMVVLLPDATMIEAIEGVVKMCHRYQKLCTTTMNLDTIHRGVPFAFGYSPYDQGVDTAHTVMQVLEQNIDPGTIPVQPTPLSRYKIGVNKEAMVKFGLDKKLPPHLLYVMEHGMFVEKIRGIDPQSSI